MMTCRRVMAAAADAPGPSSRRIRGKIKHCDYCFKSTVALRTLEGIDVGTFVGYSEDPDIADRTFAACALEADVVNGVCEPASLVLLACSTRACGGEMYYFYDGHVRFVE